MRHVCQWTIPSEREDGDCQLSVLTHAIASEHQNTAVYTFLEGGMAD